MDKPHINIASTGIAFKAMEFAREAHKDQVRKYTGNPYFDHLAEVAGISASVLNHYEGIDKMMAVAWLHDVIEDTPVTEFHLMDSSFPSMVVEGVLWLSDLEEGNRETRKRLSRERIANALPWIQTIKVADLISNTSSIVKHDPDFAKVYLKEKRLLLDVLTRADDRLIKIARSMCE